MNEKVKPHHLQRKAMVYVRQSSMQQVVYNRGSRELQYAMQQRVRELGWRDVEVVDDDLGRSASGSVRRLGFERMVAEVSLGQVGAVAAWEVSRFARNNREWQQLIEICRVVDTLLVDQDAVYTPRHGNDRLLLGLKGSLNEYELDLLRERSVQARREQARRGELLVSAPVGYRKTEDYHLEKDPDLRVQEAIELVFKKFFEVGAVRQTLMWFLEHNLQLPARKPGGETYWRRPAYATVYRLLTNPVYGGAYAYGKTEAITVYEDGQPRQRMQHKAREEWLALIPGSHEGYIAWEKFERVQSMIAANAPGAGGGGAPKRGSALLVGLLRCGRCGRKLTIAYTGAGRSVPRYCCHRGHLDNGEPRCIAFGGHAVDEAISREVVGVVQPAAIEASVLAAKEAEKAHDEVLQALERDLEAARYASNRAFKQYDAADPQNRLVAEELERRWNQTLESVQAVEQRIESHESSAHASAVADVGVFEDLGAELGSIWNGPETDIRLKKRIVRTLILEVVADVDAEGGEIILVVHWQGGVHTELRVPRRRRWQSPTHTAKPTVEAVRMLARICPDAQLAGILNRNGLKTGRGNRWTRERVTALRNYHEIAKNCPEIQEREGWRNLKEAARSLGIASRTLRLAAERGEIQAEHPLPDGPWVFGREALESAAADQLVARVQERTGNPVKPSERQRNLDLTST